MKKGSKLFDEAKKKVSKNCIGKHMGEKNGKWRGGKTIRSGYVYIYSPTHPYRSKDNYVAEHRLVMEAHLGRILLPTETPHHINGITTDNRYENLALFQCQGFHASHHSLTRVRDKNGRFKSKGEK
jgi:hypothetical protein